MRLATSTLALVGTACQFTPGVLQGNGSSDGGADGGANTDSEPAGDAGPSIVPLHVPPAGSAAGTADLVLDADVDTSALSIGGSTTLPAGVTFDVWPQLGGGELAVLHVRALSVPTSVTVRVTGSRALVVVAGGDITLDGQLAGNALDDTPGPGGAGPDAGIGKGNPGAHASNFRDSGGSGAGFATAGGTGGRVTGCMPTVGTVAAGTTYGDAMLTTLVAGSGGGTAFNGTCGNRPAGAGGGAIQLSSATRIAITLTGGVNVGGGGGGGGRSPINSSCNMTAGSGGGSGGAIVLQAPIVDVAGTLAANGGAGGSSAGDVEGDNNYPSAHGEDGQGGALSAIAATPGADVGVWSSAGGSGGANTTGPGDGIENNDCDGNGGGGGGSVGRIVIAIPTSGAATATGTASPPYTTITY